MGLPVARCSLAELRDDLGARGRHVAQDPAPDRLLERAHDLRAGTRRGYSGNGSSSRMPIISQCPVVVSLPADRSVARPCAEPASAAGRHAVDRREVAEPRATRGSARGGRRPRAPCCRACRHRRRRTPSASGASPTPHESQTTSSTRGTSALASPHHRFCLQSMQSSAHGRASSRSGSIGLSAPLAQRRTCRRRSARARARRPAGSTAGSPRPRSAVSAPGCCGSGRRSRRRRRTTPRRCPGRRPARAISPTQPLALLEQRRRACARRIARRPSGLSPLGVAPRRARGCDV